MKSKRIIIVSYGTADPDGLRNSIESVEKAVCSAFPDYDVYRAFTGKKIRELIFKKNGITIDSPEEAVLRALSDGVSEVIIQPTHLSGGLEYTAMIEDLKDYRNRFERFDISPPLTGTISDLETLAGILAGRTDGLPDHTAVLYVGHGTDADSDIYKTLREIIKNEGFTNIYITTLSESDELISLAGHIKQDGFSHCLLLPLLMVTGRHASRDIGGQDPGSYLTRLNTFGLKTKYSDESLGTLPSIHDIFTDHINKTIFRG